MGNMRLRVSENVIKRLKKLSKTLDKPIPIAKYKIPDRLQVGDTIIIRGNSTSLRAKVYDIKEYYVYDIKEVTSNTTNVSEDLNIVYEDKLKEILNNQHINKIYLVYVKILP
jgi:bisphosphoglycerate-dependent phosphoglycerate mutase